MKAPNLKNKKVFIFDLDGTLAESKQTLDFEMAHLLAELLETYKVAVIGGGSFKQFSNQFLVGLPGHAVRLENLSLFPASGSAFYEFTGTEWREVYAYRLTDDEKRRITTALVEADKRSGYGETKTYGEKIEDRATQITYSGLGQNAPIAEKSLWDPHQMKRKKIVAFLKLLLPDFSTRIGGMTSIDVTRKGVDKAYGIRQIEKALKTPIADMVFIGDALFPGGNDYPATTTGIDCIKVKNVEATKKLIRSVL